MPDREGQPDRQGQPDRDDWEFVVVGAGVVGALIAYRLAKAGRRVLVLEAGPERDRTEMVGVFARAADKGTSSPYLGTAAELESPSPREGDDSEAAHYLQAGPDPFKSTYQRLAGGSTWHWLGNTPRHLPADFRLASSYGVGSDWPVSYDDLEPWYAQAEVELGVSGDRREWDGVGGAIRSTDFPMPPIWHSYGDTIVTRAIAGHEVAGQAVRVRRTPQARNSRPYQGRPPCSGNSSCVPICPVGAKYDATVHLGLAAQLPQPPEVRHHAIVTGLVCDAEGRVTGVDYATWTEDGAQRTSTRVSAPYVILAAHAVETPLLLLDAGIAASSPVGANLMDHPQGYVVGLTPEPVYPFRGPPVVCGIDAFRDGAFRSEHAAYRMSIGNDGWGRMEAPEKTVARRIFEDGLLGEPLRRAVHDRVTRMLRLSFSTEMLPDPANRVTVAGRDARGNLRPRLEFALADYNRRAFEHANSVGQQLLERLGAEEIMFSYPDVSAFSGAGHIMGTCRMGTRPENSVTDDLGRVHGHHRLLVAGASLFPTGGTANPTLTAAALALRTAHHLATETTGA